MAAFLPAIIGAAGAIGGGYLAGRGNKPHESKMEKTKRHLIDELLGSLRGGGAYSDLFNTDEAAFKKSFLDPAKSMFNNQIAPQIQQNYIAGGQQRGSGLEDQLLRAGVDLDQILNQQYATFQNQGKDRMQNILNSILVSGSGAPTGNSGKQDLMSSLGGFLTSKGFSDSASNLFGSGSGNASQNGKISGNNQGFDDITRKGFAKDTYS